MKRLTIFQDQAVFDAFHAMLAVVSSGRSRGGLTCKIQVTPGQWRDAPEMIEVLDRIRVPRPLGGRPRTRPAHVSGDKAYSSQTLHDA